MIILFKRYDYDIAWNDEFVCDSVWSMGYHDDTRSHISQLENPIRFINIKLNGWKLEGFMCMYVFPIWIIDFRSLSTYS